MSAGPGSALGGPRAGSVQIAGSAVVVGTARLGEGSILAEGAVIRSEDTGVEVGTGSAVLENSVIVGNAVIPTVIGRFMSPRQARACPCHPHGAGGGLDRSIGDGACGPVRLACSIWYPLDGAQTPDLPGRGPRAAHGP